MLKFRVLTVHAGLVPGRAAESIISTFLAFLYTSGVACALANTKDTQSLKTLTPQVLSPEPLTLGTAPPPLSNSWIISIIWLYIALSRTPNIDCYWGEAVQDPTLTPKP